MTRRRFMTAVGIGGLTGIGAGTTTARGGSRNFRAHLSGDNEVPPVETNAQGQAVFQVSKDGTSIRYKLIVANIEDVLMAHIHQGAPDENGSVVVWLYPEDQTMPKLIEGRFDGILASAEFTEDDLVGPLADAKIDDLIDEIEEGNTYVNVHTEENPSGEVRGQIR